jgi:hypothetical protein
MKNANKKNFADVLAMDIRYAVLSKKGRIQILVKPTAKELRKRGKRGWHLFAAVDSQADAEQLLLDAFQRALSQMEMSGAAPDSNGKKKMNPATTGG